MNEGQQPNGLSKIATSEEPEAEKLSGGPVVAAATVYDWLVGDRTSDDIRSFYQTKQSALPLNDFLQLARKDSWIIDAGCGYGGITDFIRSNDFRVFGFDVSEQAINKARETYPESHFVVHNAQDIFDECRMEVGGVFDHLSLQNLTKAEMKKVFIAIYNRLSSGGVFQTTCEEADYPEQTGWYTVPVTKQINLEDGSLGSAVYFLYLSYFQKEELEKMLTDVGFQITKSSLHPEPTLTSGNVITVLCRKI